ncbi:arsenate reductase ArsC [Clostridiaceae bacterium HSG29]|nr:arsenate reductase ArsC [Clostridiaceae bacterium HSG29]
MKIAFVCVHNSCRSQMAEALMKHYNKNNNIKIYSAGTENYPKVKDKAVQVIESIGIDMKSHKPKLLSDIPEELDILITMGCNVYCPFVPNRFTEDWGIDDPSGKDISEFEITRDIIKEKVLNLIERIEKGEFNEY